MNDSDLPEPKTVQFPATDGPIPPSEPTYHGSEVHQRIDAQATQMSESLAFSDKEPCPCGCSGFWRPNPNGDGIQHEPLEEWRKRVNSAKSSAAPGGVKRIQRYWVGKTEVCNSHEVEHLETELAELRRELAMATDAANKGDRARNLADSMQQEIAQLWHELSKFKAEKERLRAALGARDWTWFESSGYEFRAKVVIGENKGFRYYDDGPWETCKTDEHEHKVLIVQIFAFEGGLMPRYKIPECLGWSKTIAKQSFDNDGIPF